MDDMVQDIVDCIEWLQNNAAMYKGDKVRPTFCFLLSYSSTIINFTLAIQSAQAVGDSIVWAFSQARLAFAPNFLFLLSVHSAIHPFM